MDTVLWVIGCVLLLSFLGWTIKRRLSVYVDERKRHQLEGEIRALADDLETDPNGMSLRDAVDLLEVHMVQELVDELRKMPPGSRSLQRAIEITGDEGYGRAA